jgi:hypothetical protein
MFHPSANVITTALIAWKVWQKNKLVRRLGAQDAIAVCNSWINQSQGLTDCLFTVAGAKHRGRKFCVIYVRVFPSMHLLSRKLTVALRSLWMIALLISYLINNNVAQVFLYGSPFIAGIASMLINVRVGLGWAAGEERRNLSEAQPRYPSTYVHTSSTHTDNHSTSVS